jgi:hypothetical protein
MQVTLIDSNSEEKTWMFPKALLAHHAGYFRRADRFKEGEENKVTLESFDPEIFELFVEFIYFGRYSYRDDLQDVTRIRDSAKAWVLGDYLDAVEFKNFAMKNLHSIYFPPDNQMPKSTVGPELVEYCCSNSPVTSHLHALFKDILITYWHDIVIIHYRQETREKWNTIWDEHRDFRNDVLYYTNQEPEHRSEARKSVESYLEKAPSDDVLAIES